MSRHANIFDSETYYATGRMNFAGSPIYKVISWLAFWLETIFLFTKSDYKTIFFPVMISACAASPPTKASQLLDAAVWVWFHLLQFNISNQTYSGNEDIVNKPWRPLPSGRISVKVARQFHWVIFVFCLCLSASHGTSVMLSSVTLSILFAAHNHFGFDLYPVPRNLANVGGYVAFQCGAILISSSKSHFDRMSLIALLASGSIIFTTIHAQDFADVEGDARVGRCTFPMIAPVWSRVSILVALPLWSIALSAMWGLGPGSGMVFLCLGAFVGSRYFWFRDVKHDEKSYLLYNVWLLAAHTLPFNAHCRVFSW